MLDQHPLLLCYSQDTNRIYAPATTKEDTFNVYETKRETRIAPKIELNNIGQTLTCMSVQYALYSIQLISLPS